MTSALSDILQAAKRSILSVGSGDGSQQVAIVRSGHTNIFSTFYDSENTVYNKYGEKAKDNIKLLRGCSEVMFNVDATKLKTYADLKQRKFDIIFFTFPHTGKPNFAAGWSGPNPASIESNKRLIKDFLKSAQDLLVVDGVIEITLKTSAPYDRWSFPSCEAYEVEPTSHCSFDASLFPGYVHRSTNVTSSGTRVNNGAARSYVFSRKRKHQEGEEEKEENSLSREPIIPHHRFKLTVHYTLLTDDDVEGAVKDILKAAPSRRNSDLNVLDIRRYFPEAIRPDTRQLNRVVYDMESKGSVLKGAPSTESGNKKPTWKLIE